MAHNEEFSDLTDKDGFVETGLIDLTETSLRNVLTTTDPQVLAAGERVLRQVIAAPPARDGAC
jgi:hypothetical protein